MKKREYYEEKLIRISGGAHDGIAQTYLSISEWELENRPRKVRLTSAREYFEWCISRLNDLIDELAKETDNNE